MQAMGTDKKKIALVDQTKYLGVVMQHFDEDEITYWSLRPGRQFAPVKLFTFILPDITDLPKRGIKDPSCFSINPKD